MTEYGDEDISKIQLSGEEPPWDPSTEEYSECETSMLNHQHQIVLSAKTSVCQCSYLELISL